MFNDKIILITGGSGTVGSALVEYILANYSPKVIRIYSRDETKQYNLKNKLKHFEKNLRFFIGDIRDKERLNRAMQNVDIVFNLAALKHVVACEYNPFEAIKTNVLGLQNLIEICIDNNIEKVVFTSSDKAATPCNTMGVTKLLGEKLITSANFYKGDKQTLFYSVRLGNVLGSRGSLIPLIKEQIENNLPITLTDGGMTRYIIGISNAIKFIIDTIKIGQGGEVFVPKMNAIKIIDLIEVLANIFAKQFNKKVEKIQIKEIGMFAGEKLYEELFSIEEAERTYELKNMYIIFPQLTEVFKLIDPNLYPNIKKYNNLKQFNSKEGPFLSKEEIQNFLKKSNLL